MIPLYIHGCFGMLHPAQGQRAVLICGPLGDEALNSHRPLLFLAERLAAAGFPTLRLAYRGTGDSAGTDDEPGRFGQWIDSIREGAGWLAEHGAARVTVVGVRIGAGLAARVACDIDAVDSLAMLCPITGRQFLHELTLAARIAQRVWQTGGKLDDGTWFESHGLRIDHPTRDALDALDLRRLPGRPAAHLLLLESEAHAVPAARIEALRRLGADVAFERCDGIDRILNDSPEAEVPHVALDRIVGWIQALPGAAVAGAAEARPAGARSGWDEKPFPLPLREGIGGGGQPQVCAGLPPPPNPLPQGEGGSALRPALALDAGRETPIRFAGDPGLFGILSTPDRMSPDAPALLLVNTSANPRWGNGRVAVKIARSLMADGVATLRMDASGMGDASPRTGATGRPYTEDVTANVLDGAAELARQVQRPVVILGICSGAYHAFQAACRDAGIVGAILVNLQRFVWRPGDPTDAARGTNLRSTDFYLRNAMDPRAWHRLVRGEFDAGRLVRVLGSRMARHTTAAADPLLRLFPGATRVGQARQAFAALHARGVPVLYMLGRNDPGVDELAANFGRDGARLRKYPNVTIRTLDGADHTLSADAVQSVLIREIRDWYRALPRPASTTQAAFRCDGSALRYGAATGMSQA